jgi:HSP20 family molecular chaperone IbpA
MFFAPVVRTRAYAPALRSYDRSFERFINDAFFTHTFPGVQVAQDDKAWTITLDVPGLTKEDLNIGIEGNVVRLDSRKEARPARLDVKGVVVLACCCPACRRMAAAMAIMAPLSVHRCSSG